MTSRGEVAGDEPAGVGRHLAAAEVAQAAIATACSTPRRSGRRGVQTSTRASGLSAVAGTSRVVRDAERSGSRGASRDATSRPRIVGKTPSCRPRDRCAARAPGVPGGRPATGWSAALAGRSPAADRTPRGHDGHRAPRSGSPRPRAEVDAHVMASSPRLPGGRRRRAASAGGRASAGRAAPPSNGSPPAGRARRARHQARPHR